MIVEENRSSEYDMPRASQALMIVWNATRGILDVDPKALQNSIFMQKLSQFYGFDIILCG